MQSVFIESIVFLDVVDHRTGDEFRLYEQAGFNPNAFLCSGYLYFGDGRYYWVDDTTSELKSVWYEDFGLEADKTIYDMYAQGIDFSDIFTFLKLTYSG